VRPWVRFDVGLMNLKTYKNIVMVTDDDLISDELRKVIDAGAREYATTSFGGRLLDAVGLPLATVRARPTSDDQTTWIVYLDPGEQLGIQEPLASFLELWGHQDKRRYPILRMTVCALDVGLFLCSWCLFCENLRENDQALARWQFVSTCCIVDEHGGLVAVGLGEFLD